MVEAGRVKRFQKNFRKYFQYLGNKSKERYDGLDVHREKRGTGLLDYP